MLIKFPIPLPVEIRLRTARRFRHGTKKTNSSENAAKDRKAESRSGLTVRSRVRLRDCPDHDRVVGIVQPAALVGAQV